MPDKRLGFASSVRESPYRHTVFAEAFAPTLANELISWLDGLAWTPRSGGFFRFDAPREESWRASLLDVVRGAVLTGGRLAELEEVFQCRLRKAPILELQRYTRGAGIGVHTDFGVEEVRCVVNLNRGWHLREGGVWVLACDSALSRDVEYLPSLSNTGFAFSTGRQSFHAFSRYAGSTAYGVVVRLPRVLLHGA
jgi:hypothetical protein